MKLSLAISHTPWKSERVESMARLRGALMGLDGVYDGFAYAREETEKAPNHVWSERMWQWAVETDAHWCGFLQDDALVAPNFRSTLQHIIANTEASVIGLQVAHPGATLLAQEGYKGVTTTDALVGVGY